MKKIALLTAALVLMASVFASCGDKTNSSSNTGSSVPSEASVSQAEDLDSMALEGSTDAERLQNFLKMDGVETILEGMKQSLGDAADTMDISMIERDGKLVYVFQYKTDVSAETGAKLETQLETLKSTYSYLASQLSAIGVEKPVVVVEYLDKTGKVLASAEYTPE